MGFCKRNEHWHAAPVISVGLAELLQQLALFELDADQVKKAREQAAAFVQQQRSTNNVSAASESNTWKTYLP